MTTEIIIALIASGTAIITSTIATITSLKTSKRQANQTNQKELLISIDESLRLLKFEKAKIKAFGDTPLSTTIKKVDQKNKEEVFSLWIKTLEEEFEFCSRCLENISDILDANKYQQLLLDKNRITSNLTSIRIDFAANLDQNESDFDFIDAFVEFNNEVKKAIEDKFLELVDLKNRILSNFKK